jgi:hypothetical protein
MCEKDGIPIADAVEMFVIAAENADLLVCHNTPFDKKLLASSICGSSRGQAQGRSVRQAIDICTMKVSTPVCRIGKKDGRTGYKWPKLSEAITVLLQRGTGERPLRNRGHQGDPSPVPQAR